MTEPLDDATGLYIGLISGTSADGIDAALVRFEHDKPQLVHALTHAWPDALRTQILRVAQDETTLDLDAFGHLDVAIGQTFADAVKALLVRSGTPASSVRAVGSHGQTIRHRPFGEHPFTLQIGNASVIAEHCDIDVVADFRSADVAAGGQGAPLLPAVHAMLLNAPDHTRVVLNLGGIANITVLAADGQVFGFDTGPANGLMDAWCLRHHGEAFDRDGAFAASGQVDDELLATLLDDPYFTLPPPKSTGREHFHLGWLDARLYPTSASPADVQATLLELTARSVAMAIDTHARDAKDVLLCGGGVHNRVLVQRLRELSQPRELNSTADYGVDPDYLEATAFAWLARQRLLGLPGNLPAVTGARGPRVLGAIHLAPRETR
ncbi:anhydro-N-acetylmuramic acid kinase [Dyella nitratireducens]|uniref:Anhydro-N-acetylmuramic acid kinase n=1 Tax=Dyella nitratireducens TaxID=1849580 RepID=A0ABQ1FY15_9GAMM|nr:anhydro-N-acetylmuramic acid kinase [Dyella nitratireducens]GGA32708.1 anhydro-N-acetylmuramic acid kinase [Dyella nitratireducens]GLQ42706.1 anhydro-N-acetylmuramic acid kinase [Dyella nitratireducens]